MPRSLSRGLEILAFLNKAESASILEVSKALAIPRATLYRILETLVSDGYLEQHRSDHRFRLTPRVRELSEGFSDAQLLASIARPFLSLVTQKLSWPVSLGALHGLDVVIRENTDDLSPLATDRFNVGYRMPLLTTATGLCILAHIDLASRNAMLAALAERDAKAALGTRARATLEKKLASVRGQGFASYDRLRQRTVATSIAVPIVDAGDNVRAAVTLRYAKDAVPAATAVREFVPVLQQAAERIATRIPSEPRR